jgi:glycosyltransferase involved in cell wall biosynthesis
MENPEISILVSVYNKEHYIQDALASIAIQRNFPSKSLEVVIVDDNSSDSSFERAREFLGRSNLSYKLIMQNSKVGASKARNILMNEARGEIYIHLDGDDLLHQDCVSKVYNAFKENTLAGFVYSHHLSIKEDTKGPIPSDEQILPTSQIKPDFDIRSFLEGKHNYIGAVKAIRASQALPFDETLPYAEDADWIIKHGLNRVSFFRIPEVLYYWRRGVKGLSESISKEIADWWHNFIFDRGIQEFERRQRTK